MDLHGSFIMCIFGHKENEEITMFGAWTSDPKHLRSLRTSDLPFIALLFIVLIIFLF